MPTTARSRRAPQRRLRTALSLPGASSTHASLNDNASLSLGVGVTALSIVAWNRPRALSGALVNKGTLSAATHEYGLIINSNLYEARLSDGAALKTVTASNYGTVEVGVLSMVAVTWDAANLFISVNTGPQNSIAAAITVQDSTNHMRIGAREDGFLNHNGDMGPVLIYKGRTLTPAEIAFLYNGGSPLTFAQLPGSFLTSLVAAWDWSDGSAVDKSGSGNDLTLTAGVFYCCLRPYGGDQA